MKMKYLTEEDFIQKVFDYKNHPTSWEFIGERPCIIDFYTSWCKTCTAATSVLNELAEIYRDKIDVYRIDAEKEHELASVFGIRSVPSILLCPTADVPKIINGVLHKEQYMVLIDSIISD